MNTGNRAVADGSFHPGHQRAQLFRPAKHCAAFPEIVDSLLFEASPLSQLRFLAPARRLFGPLPHVDQIVPERGLPCHDQVGCNFADPALEPLTTILPRCGHRRAKAVGQRQTQRGAGGHVAPQAIVVPPTRRPPSGVSDHELERHAPDQAPDLESVVLSPHRSAVPAAVQRPEQRIDHQQLTLRQWTRPAGPIPLPAALGLFEAALVFPTEQRAQGGMGPVQRAGYGDAADRLYLVRPQLVEACREPGAAAALGSLGAG